MTTPSKYRSRVTEYAGRKYHSAAEAKHAAELDIRKKAGLISDWVPQVALPIFVNGVKICTMVADFSVWTNAQHWYEEVKGAETAVYKLKLKLLKATNPHIDLRVIKA